MSTSKSVTNLQKTPCLTFRRALASITLEPVIFLLSMSMILIELYMGSLIVNKVCRITFNYDLQTCENLTAFPHLEAEVQKVASNYALYFSLVETIPSLIFVTFLGPWSDRHGRKLPMVMSLTTYALSALIPLSLAEFEQLPPYFLLLRPVITCLSGGYATISVAFFGYITDTTDERTLTMRMGFMNGAWYLGSPLGSFLAGFLLRNWGYACVFSVGIIILLVCLIYTIIMIKDPPRPVSLKVNSKKHSKNLWKDLFDIQNLKDSFQSFFNKRTGHKRLHLWLLTVCKCGIFLTGMGNGSVYYLFTRLNFEWSDTMFSYSFTSSSIICFFSSVFLMPFLIKYAKVEDMYLFIMGVTGCLIVDIITAFSTAGWMLFVAPLVLVHEYAYSPMRSLLIRCVEIDEVGKLFAILSVIECGIPILSGVLYSQIYNATHDEFPGAVFLVSCSVYILILCIMSGIVYDTWKNENNKCVCDSTDQSKKDSNKTCNACDQENQILSGHIRLMRVRSSISQ